MDSTYQGKQVNKRSMSVKSKDSVVCGQDEINRQKKDPRFQNISKSSESDTTRVRVRIRIITTRIPAESPM
jgi:hypothetical protein